jgi:hypothetical protein
MARIRSVKPEFWADRRLATRVGRDARLLYVALWNFADEHSRLQGDARYVKGNCLPYDDDVSLDCIDELLEELELAGRILRYEHEGDPYIFLPKLAEHQRLEPGKVPSRLPAPPVGQPDPDHDRYRSEPRADESARDADENALLYVAGGREQVAGSRGAALARRTHETEPRETDYPEDPTSALLVEHVRAYAQPPPQAAQNRVKVEIMRLVAERVEPERIRNGLARLREKQLSASLLPQLVTETTSIRRPSTTDQRVADGLALAAELKAEGQ